MDSLLSNIMFPDFHGNSLVNLMASIGKRFGWKSPYRELKSLPSSQLSNSVLLLLIDGLGLNYFKKHAKKDLKSHFHAPITSLFPSGTASCITSIHTGVAPQQHAITGWHTNFKELGKVATILPFKERQCRREINTEAEKLIDSTPFSKKISTSSAFVTKSAFKTRGFNSFATGDSKFYGYSTLNGFFRQTRKAASKNQFTYGYWTEFDHIAHHHGTNSKKLKKHFHAISEGFCSLLSRLKNTTVILTADHGFIDLPKKRIIDMKEHPKMADMLSFPLCGTWRASYAYVRIAKSREFEHYVKSNLSDSFEIHKSKDLIQKNRFGLFNPSPRLIHRIGDFTLIAKENFALRERLLEEKEIRMKAIHGGTSPEEMEIPLLFVQT